MPYVVFLCTVIIPIGLWLWFIRREDASEPEPGRLLRQCFYLGILSGLAAAIVEGVFFSVMGFPRGIVELANTPPVLLTYVAVLFVGPIEELAKYILLRARVYVSHDFNQVFDGIVYGITVALGFSFVENLFYFVEFYTTRTPMAFILLTSIRGLLSTFAHITFTGIMGYFIGKAKFSAKNRFRTLVLGVSIASFLHSGYDLLLTSTIPYAIVWAALLNVLCFSYFKRLWNRPYVRMVWKYVPARVEPKAQS